MSSHPDDVLKVLKQAHYDLSVIQTRVAEAIRAIAALPTAPVPELVCPTCRRVYRSPNALAEHRYRSHDGPVPEHYLAAERAAGFTVDVPDAAEAAPETLLSVPVPLSEEEL